MLLIKTGLYRIWCGVYTLGNWHSAFVNPAGQLLLTRRVNNSWMDGVGIVFYPGELYIARH